MGKRGNMPGLLGFIDSPDIRVFNKDTVFTPIEQAVLVSRSRHRTLEEKIDALNYLLGHYTEGEFQEGAEKVGGYCKGTDGGFRSCILRTLNEWEQVLEDRYLEKGYVFAACLNEKDYRQDGVSDYCYFSSYGKAYGYLTGMKKEYLTDGRLRQAKTFGIIHRFQLDGTFGERPSQDTYFFDHGMRLVDGVKAADGYLGTNLEGLSIYVPLPFEVGDIVKVENPFWEDYYGIVSHKRTPKMALAGMVTSIDTFDAGTKSFDYTDDTDILAMVNCPDEEIPENQKVLKALRDVFMGDALFCTVSVRDNDGNWVGKQDVGTPSYAEPVKGAASDAFKRACFNLGIGRELYTAPFIWIPAGKAGVEKEKDKYVAKGRFRVSKIGYDAKRAINELHIVDASGAEVYAYKAAKKDAADGAAEKAGSMGREPEKELRMELQRTGISEEAVCSRYHVADISEIKGELYGRAMAALRKTKDAA